MMNWKGLGRKWSWLNRNISRHLPGRSGENHQKYPVRIAGKGKVLSPIFAMLILLNAGAFF
jgi:hypothetical protein